MHIKTTFRLLLLLFSFAISFSIFGQQLPDISSIKDRASLEAFYARTKQREKDEKKFNRDFKYAMLDSALYNGTLVTDVVLYEDNFTFKAINKNGSFIQNLLSGAEKKYGKFLSENDDSYRGIAFKAATPDEEFKLQTTAKSRKDINKLTEVEWELKFNPVYTQAYPLLAKKIKSVKGIEYYLSVESDENNYTVSVDGVPVVISQSNQNNAGLSINPFLLTPGKPVNIKVHVTPGVDQDGRQLKQISKRGYFEATLSKIELDGDKSSTLEEIPLCKGYHAYVTDTIVEDGRTRYSSYPGNPAYGSEALECNQSFTPEGNYSIESWKQGNDLKSDKNLKSKITALYKQLGETILNGDQKAFSDLIIKPAEAEVISTYNNQPSKIIKQWEQWLTMFDFVNVANVETDFDILFSADGKLAIAIPKKQKHMLRAVGLRQAIGFTYYIYSDNNQLKFIR